MNSVILSLNSGVGSLSRPGASVVESIVIGLS